MNKCRPWARALEYISNWGDSVVLTKDSICMVPQKVVEDKTYATYIIMDDPTPLRNVELY